MRIKYTGDDFVTSHAVAEETGNAVVAPGEVLDLSPALAESLSKSSVHFKLMEEKKTTTKPKRAKEEKE